MWDFANYISVQFLQTLKCWWKIFLCTFNLVLPNLNVGTASFIQENSQQMPAIMSGCEEDNATTCRKDTGGRKSLQKWSRGHLFIVRAGGHIEYWQSLYRLVSVLSFTRLWITNFGFVVPWKLFYLFFLKSLKKMAQAFIIFCFCVYLSYKSAAFNPNPRESSNSVFTHTLGGLGE